jgi:hypothetical protein
MPKKEDPIAEMEKALTDLSLNKHELRMVLWRLRKIRKSRRTR